MTLQKISKISEDKLLEIKELCLTLSEEEYQKFKEVTLSGVAENIFCTSLLKVIFGWIDMTRT